MKMFLNVKHDGKSYSKGEVLSDQELKVLFTDAGFTSPCASVEPEVEPEVVKVKKIKKIKKTGKK